LATLGFASFFLLWLAVVTGFVLHNSWTHTWIRRPTLYTIHQTLSVTGLCLGVFHGLAQVIVPKRAISLLEVVVPFVDSDDPIGIGVGVVGFELMLAVSLSMVIQRRLGYARWRLMHLLTYAAFMLTVAHVLISGSDVTSAWVWPLVLAAWLVTVALWLTTTSMLDGVRLWLGRHRPARNVKGLAIRVDPQLCARFGFCEHVAPEVFQLRGDGQLSYLSTVPVEQANAVVRAIEMCPTRAIIVADQSTGGMYAASDPYRAETGAHTDPRAVPGVRRRNAISQW
jgi:sulfoxide reductase heme-binding subunit YedZ